MSDRHLSPRANTKKQKIEIKQPNVTASNHFWTSEGGMLRFLLQKMIATHFVSMNNVVRLNRASARAIESVYGQEVRDEDDEDFFDAGLVSRVSDLYTQKKRYSDRKDRMYEKYEEDEYRHKEIRRYLGTKFEVQPVGENRVVWVRPCQCRGSKSHDMVRCLFKPGKMVLDINLPNRSESDSQEVLALPDDLESIFGTRCGAYAGIESHDTMTMDVSWKGHKSYRVTLWLDTMRSHSVQQKRFLYRRGVDLFYEHQSKWSKWNNHDDSEFD